MANLKEEMQLKELHKAADKKRQEKLDDAAAKKRIQEKIAADKEARRLKAEQAKAQREGREVTDNAVSTAQATPASTSSGSSSQPATKQHTEARLRLQTASGTITKTFGAETTLFEIAQSLVTENGGHEVSSLTMTFPKKVFSGEIDFAKTVKEAGLMPSAVLIVK